MKLTSNYYVTNMLATVPLRITDTFNGKDSLVKESYWDFSLSHRISFDLFLKILFEITDGALGFFKF